MQYSEYFKGNGNQFSRLVKMDVLNVKKDNIGLKTQGFLRKGIKSVYSSEFSRKNPDWGISVNLTILFSLAITGMYQFDLIPYKHMTPELPEAPHLPDYPPPYVVSMGDDQYSLRIPSISNSVTNIQSQNAIETAVFQAMSGLQLDSENLDYINNVQDEVIKSLEGDSFFVPNVTYKDFGLEEYTISETSLGAIYTASNRTEVGVGLLLAIASKESNFREDVSSYSGGSAQGLFQFNEATWLGVLKQLGPDYGYTAAANMIEEGSGLSYYVRNSKERDALMAMRDNPYHSSVLSAALLLDNQQRVERVIGKSLNNTDKYLTHFLGVSNSIFFLRKLQSNPNSYPSSFSKLSGPIKYNRNIFFDRNTGSERNFSEVYQHIKQDFEPRVAYYSLMYGKINTDEHDFARGYIEKHDIAQMNEQYEPKKM